MKSMCYLSSISKKDTFDELADELDITVIHYCTEQIKSLVAFVSREKTMPSQSYLVMDLCDTDFSAEHIISAIQTLRCISSARPIILNTKNEKTDELFGKLINFRVTNLISVSPTTNVVEEMRACLSDDGIVFTDKIAELQNSKAVAANSVVQPLIIPEGMNVTICVAGCMPRIGTTTQVFALWHFLKSLGFSPAILCKDDRFIKLLLELYQEDAVKYEEHISVKSIPFCFQRDTELWNAYIVDIGVLNEDNCQFFMDADVSVLVGGAKPWELECFATSLRLTEKAKRMVALMSFTTPKDLDELHDILNIMLYCVPYHPDIWEKGGSIAAYKASVLPLIKEICHQQ